MLDGFLKVFLNLDEVIRIIRSEDEPKPALMAAFGLTDVQAEAILNMRLRSLRRLEEMEIRREHKDLGRKSARSIQALLGDDKRAGSGSTTSWRRHGRNSATARWARAAPVARGGARRSRGGDRGAGGTRTDHRDSLRQGLDPRRAGRA